MNDESYCPPSSSPVVQHPSSKELVLLKLEFLKKIDLFKSFPETTLKLIAGESRNTLLNKDALLFNEGETDNIKSFYIILSGEIFIFKGSTFKKPIATLGSGEYFGEMSMIDAQPRSASAIATAPTILMEIQEAVFNEYIASNSKALLEMMKIFSRRMRVDLQIMAGDMQKICNFTHDMRNCLVPLGIAEANLTKMHNILNGMDESHLKRKGGATVEKSFKTMLSVRNNLITLIDQSLACVNKSKLQYVKGEFEISSLVEETIDEISCHKNLRDKNIFVTQKSAMLKKGLFNFLDIKRVLQNLLINAGYVSDKGGNIEVLIVDVGGFNQVSVKDHGGGIPEDVQKVLLKENFTSKPDGNGFGLMSCREIIEDFHEGKIWFDSEFNQGTTFHITVPHCTCAPCIEPTTVG